MGFSGPAPEAINGRLAMLGFIAAVAAELSSGQSVLAQLRDAPTPILGAFVLFAAASLVPILKGANLKESFGPFNPSVSHTVGWSEEGECLEAAPGQSLKSTIMCITHTHEPHGCQRHPYYPVMYIFWEMGGFLLLM